VGTGVDLKNPLGSLNVADKPKSESTINKRWYDFNRFSFRELTSEKHSKIYKI